MVRPMVQDGSDEARTESRRALFAPVRRTRSSDEVVDQIRRAILDDQLRQGDRLPSERDLCGQFDVSRATLREGLRTLEALGVITIRPGSAGGIFVSEPQGDQVGAALEALLRFRRVTVEELAEFRVSFEGESAHWAARRATEDDIAVLLGHAGRFHELAADPSVPWPVFVDIDIAFHQAVAESSKNQVRAAIMLGILGALREASRSIAEHTGGPVRVAIARELHAIADAIRKRDPVLASQRMRRHVKKYSELERRIHQKRSSSS